MWIACTHRSKIHGVHWAGTKRAAVAGACGAVADQPRSTASRPGIAAASSALTKAISAGAKAPIWVCA